jgi:hypothetical protein
MKSREPHDSILPLTKLWIPSAAHGPKLAIPGIEVWLDQLVAAVGAHDNLQCV